MKKQRSPTLSAKMRLHTPYRPKCANRTRWSSVFDMLLKYVDLRPVVLNLHLKDVDELLLEKRDDRCVDDLLIKMRDLDSVTKAVQKDTASLADIREYFDETIDKYPSTAAYIAPDAQIVHHKDFESAIVKLQSTRSSPLTRTERETIKSLLLSNTQEEAHEDDGRLTLAERVNKKRRMEKISCHGYQNTQFLLPTSNLCETFFSKAGYALGDRRRGIQPQNFEQQLFIHANAKFWGLQQVMKAVMTSSDA